MDTTGITLKDNKQDSNLIIDRLRNQLLKDFEEPDLQKEGVESYRFVFLDHTKPASENLIVYRVFEEKGKYYSVMKWHRKQNHNQKDTLTLETNSKTINEDEWYAVKTLINGSYFWSLEMTHSNPVGLTDDLWILEGRHIGSVFTSGKSYNLVMRWDAYEGSFKSACEKIKEICQ